MTQTRQHAGHDLGVAVAQQADDRAPPDFLHSLLFKEEAAPNAVHNVQTTAGDGDVDVRVLIELAAIGVQGAEDADLNAQLARVPELGPGGAAEQVVEQRSVVAEERPGQVWHGKDDVLPFTVGQDVLLLSNSLLGGLHAAGAAGLCIHGAEYKAELRSCKAPERRSRDACPVRALRSLVVSPPSPPPASRSYWRSQIRRVSGVQPILGAMELMADHCES